MKVIFFDIANDDMILAVRAARWLLDRPEQKDAILSYGERKNTTDLYVKRNKTSITVRDYTLSREEAKP